MMPRSAPASASRTCFCSCGGKKSMTRLMVSVRVGGVQRRHDEVAGLGGGQGRLDRLVVTHLADEDDVGVLPHRGAQRGRRSRRCRARTSRWLIIDELVEVQDLDRVLDRDDVDLAVVVDVVDHAGEGRGLAGAGRAGDEHQAAGLHAPAALSTGGRPRSSSGMAPTLTRRKTRPAEPRERNALTRNRPRPGTRVGEVGLVGLRRTPRPGRRAAPRATMCSVSAGVRLRRLQLAQAAVDAHPRRRARP